VHDRTVPVSCNPHERNSSAASARSPNHTGVRTGTATAKEGRGALRRTKESQSHRPASAPAPQAEVRTRAVLPGGHCSEHQAAGPVPQPTNDLTSSRHFIEEGRSRLTQLQNSIPEIPKTKPTFSTPTPVLTKREHVVAATMRFLRHNLAGARWKAASARVDRCSSMSAAYPATEPRWRNQRRIHSGRNDFASSRYAVAAGIVTSNSVPEPSRLHSVSVPPSFATRSCIPDRPQ